MHISLPMNQALTLALACSTAFLVYLSTPARQVLEPSVATSLVIADKATRDGAPVTPVVLELFTSQGCSSCPPADRVLAELVDEPGVIALSYHVDYWNYLGWEDPFSSPYYSARQREYTEALHARTYTPQVVINGRYELVGSRRQEVMGLAQRAQTEPMPAQPSLQVAEKSPQTIQVNYEMQGDTTGLRVTALLVQRRATSFVKRGENKGRKLRHVNVVRDMKHAPAAAAGGFTLDLPDQLAAVDCSTVLLVEREADRRIQGAAIASLSAK